MTTEQVEVPGELVREVRKRLRRSWARGNAWVQWFSPTDLAARNGISIEQAQAVMQALEEEGTVGWDENSRTYFLMDLSEQAS